MNTISTLWPRLDPTVQQWLFLNPGCIVLPRTLVNRVEATTGESMSTDGHGEHWFSGEELDFLKARTHAGALAGTSVRGPDLRRRTRRTSKLWTGERIGHSGDTAG